MPVIALIPAHNEEEQIETMLQSLMCQTRPIDKIVVVLDNCTDRTEGIALAYNVTIFETVGNVAKKAGALNQSLPLCEGYDYILEADADSILDKHFVERAIEEIETDPAIGAVSAREGMRPLKPKHFGQRIVHAVVRYQRYLWDTMRMEQPNNTNVVVGPAALLRTEAVRSAKGWDNASLTEDLALSLDLREHGWRTILGRRCYVWSDSPLTLKGLWQQRVRWSRGYEDVKKRRWSRASLSAKVEILSQKMLLIWLVLWAIGMLTALTTHSFQVSFIWLLVTAIVMIDRLLRLRLFPKVHFSDLLLTLPPLELLVFACWQATIIAARVQGIRKIERRW